MLPVIDDHLGIERKLGYRPPTPDSRLKRANRSDISVVTTLIPQSQWVECDYVTVFPKTLILDQGQLGACVGFSCAGANARMRYIRRGEVIIPSGFYIYDQINGGQDNGAIIDDAQTEIMSVGAPTQDAYPRCLFRARQDPPGVPFYKEDVPVNITGSADAATALMLGWFPQMPVNVTSTFERFTANGVAWGGVAPSDGSSNHSIYLAGLKLISGVWYFILVNSWSSSWGPFGNGTCLIPLAALDNPAVTDDAWCHVSILDPDSPVTPT